MESGVIFQVFDAQNEDRRVQANKVVVGELSGDEVWRLEGDAILRELIYGKPIEGMTSILAPQPLERGKEYYIIVEGGERWRGGHYGSSAFTVGEDGRIWPAPLKFEAPSNFEE